MSVVDRALGWLPADSRRGVVRRAGVVLGVALAIALIIWGVGGPDRRLAHTLTYSIATSVSIWFLSDPLRVASWRLLRLDGPHYWAFTPRVGLFMVVASTVGYGLGTAAGDALTGRSTWGALAASPTRLVGFWLSGLVISGFFVLGFYQRAKSEELRRHAQEARLKLLETQLEPHMLFNTLANLRVLIQLDPPRAVAMLDRLNDYLRATLRGSRTDPRAGRHTLADECARLRDYLELMAVRMGPRLAFGFDLPDDLAAQPVPPLLLQPLVENAIRHGLEPKLEGGRIDVRARRDGAGAFVIEVADTGVGLPAPADRLAGTPASPTAGEPDDAATGFGLAQVRERVASLPGGAGRVDVDSRPGLGTTIRLRLPLSDTEATR